MRTVIPALSLVIALATPCTAGAADRGELRTYAANLRLIEEGRVEEATTGLAQLADATHCPTARRYARLMHRQLTGGSGDRLGVYRRRQLVDAVVLVPDERSLLAAIDLWRKDAMFPVLIDDAWFAPIFIRSYQPKRVVRWRHEPAGELGRSAVERWARRHNATVDKPPGLVVVDPAGPQRVAGLTLAKAYGQPVTFIETPGKLWDQLSEEKAQQLRAQVEDALRSHGLARPDRWCGVTLAGDYPHRYHVSAQRGHYNATDDLLGRDASGARLGVCGRLTGQATMANYQAMASLFLTPRRALLFDGYASRPAGFKPFALRPAAGLLRPRFDVTLVDDTDHTAERFTRLTRGDEPFDMIWLNSSGLSKHFDLQGRAYPEHLPIGRAGAISMIHSFSLQQPLSSNSVGGRLLHGGAYWHFGSVHEPYLTAFVTPTAAAARARHGTPVSFALRQPPGHPLSQPWKLMLVGNPLWAWHDQPDRRTTGELPEGAEPVVFDGDAPAIERLRCAVVLGRSVGAAWLDELAQDPDPLSPDQLARVVYELQRRDRVEPIMGLPTEQLKRHPIAWAIAGDVTAERFDRSLREGDGVRATRALPRLVRFDGDPERLEPRLRRWLSAMDRNGQGARARRMLTALRDDPQTAAAQKKAITQALAKTQAP